MWGEPTETLLWFIASPANAREGDDSLMTIEIKSKNKMWNTCKENKETFFFVVVVVVTFQ